MFLWSYLNGKLEDSGKSDPFLAPLSLPPMKKTVWTQCAFVENATLEKSSNEGSCLLGSGEVMKPKSKIKTIFKEMISVLKLPKYRMLKYKVIPGYQKKKKYLFITNSQYIGILGHNLDPLMLTLTSAGKVTLKVIFRPIEEFSILNPDKSIQMNNFKEVLDRISTYSFCPGISNKNAKRCRKQIDVVCLTYPFKRYQSESCPVWYQSGKDLASLKIPLSHCEDCVSINSSINKYHKTKKNTSLTKTLVIGQGKLPSENIIISDVLSSEKVIIKEMDKVVVEKVERVDSVLECIPQIPP